MDGVLSDGRIGKVWMCKREGGHGLGVVLRVFEGGHFSDRLALFRNAVDVSGAVKSIRLDGVSIIAMPEGTAHDIECDICKAKRSWWWGGSGLDRLMEKRKERMKVNHASAN